MSDLEQTPADTEWHRWVPIGQTLDTSGVPGSGPVPSIAAFELLPLAEMLVPEKPRSGELDPSECGHCKPSKNTIWHDDEWQVSSGFEGGVGLPFVGSISPRRHLWAYTRPLGMMQGRGAILPYWEQSMPAMPETMMREHIEIVAEALAAGGGMAFPHR